MWLLDKIELKLIKIYISPAYAQNGIEADTHGETFGRLKMKIHFGLCMYV